MKYTGALWPHSIKDFSLTHVLPGFTLGNLHTYISGLTGGSKLPLGVSVGVNGVREPCDVLETCRCI